MTNNLATANKFKGPDIQWVPFPRAMVEAVDKLIEYAKVKQSPNGHVEWDGDWDIIARIFHLWAIYRPEEYKAFAKQQEFLKSSQVNDLGTAQGLNGAEVQHMLEVPPEVDVMIKSFFPNQRTQDRKFVLKLAKTLPILQVAEKL